MAGTTPRLFLNDRELAELTGVSRVTWQQRRSRGEGPPFIKVGRRVIYRWEDVESWMDAQRRI